MTCVYTYIIYVTCAAQGTRALSDLYIIVDGRLDDASIN